jgi:hypothetical protein
MEGPMDGHPQTGVVINRCSTSGWIHIPEPIEMHVSLLCYNRGHDKHTTVCCFVVLPHLTALEVLIQGFLEGREVTVDVLDDLGRQVTQNLWA